MPATVFENLDQLKGAAGQKLGYSGWIEVTQERVNLFADATGDHQWIHVDPERAAAGPFGRTIAHGYLTLSLVPMLMPQILEVHGISMGINYGTNRVRFPSPVPVGSMIRASAEILSVSDVAGGVQVTTRVTVEREGGGKPVCVVETIARYLAREPGSEAESATEPGSGSESGSATEPEPGSESGSATEPEPGSDSEPEEGSPESATEPDSSP